MIKNLHILLVLFFFGCSHTTKKETHRVELRDLTVFEFDSLISKSNWEVKIRERDSVIIYNYKNLKDSTKSINFRYLKHNNTLLSGPFKFNKSKNYSYSNIENFNYYNSDPRIMDGPGPVLFNKTYGILGFSGSMGTQYYFTNDLTKKIKLPIFYKKTQ